MKSLKMKYTTYSKLKPFFKLLNPIRFLYYKYFIRKKVKIFTNQKKGFLFIDEIQLINPYVPPYSESDFANAKSIGLDLDHWDDYCKYYELGEEEDLY